MRYLRRVPTRLGLIGAAGLAALLVPACSSTAHDATAAGHGGPSGSSGPSGGRPVDIVMVDSAFQPTEVSVRRGETVTFRFRNDGAVVHEALIGDEAEQVAHHAEMLEAGTMAPSMGHDDAPAGHGSGHDPTADGHGPMAVTVAPQSSGELTYTFAESTALWIGCHQPGHWEAGMKLQIRVS